MDRWGAQSATRVVGRITIGFVAAMGAALIGSAGCSARRSPDHDIRAARGYIFYCDGAGGGSVLKNWGTGIRQGLKNAGYIGSGEGFRWQTGLGIAADQVSSVEYKRSRAAELAKKIQAYSAEHPDAPVTLMGLSAGTAVAVFALEALPATCTVRNVVLLSSSLSEDYDLTEALRRVRGRVYVFTSEKDSVLTYLVPMAGTADRKHGDTPSAGLRGFVAPVRVSAETGRQYGKLVHIHWKPEFIEKGDAGGHTDVVNARFVQSEIAPLIMTRAVRLTTTAPAPGTSLVANPDCQRWMPFREGSTSVMEGHQKIGESSRPVRITARLIEKTTGTIVLERSYVMLDDDPATPQSVRRSSLESWIDPQGHPFVDAATRVSRLPVERVRVGGALLECEVTKFEARGDFAEWGRDVTATLYTSPKVPGGLVRVSLKSHRGSLPFEFEGQLVEYKVATE